MKKQKPKPGQLLWTGKACNTVWEIHFLEVNQPTEQTTDEHGLVNSLDEYWQLQFSSVDGQELKYTWSPNDKILFGTLHGWESGSIMRLKNCFINHNWERTLPST